METSSAMGTSTSTSTIEISAPSAYEPFADVPAQSILRQRGAPASDTCHTRAPSLARFDVVLFVLCPKGARENSQGLPAPGS